MNKKWSPAQALWVLLWATASQAQSQLELVEPEPGYYRPDEALSFQVPVDMPVEVLQRLSLELDGIDVTSFISREGDKAVYNPPQPLTYGAHRLRLVEYLPDGDIVERALYTIEVRKNSAFREADAFANLDLSSTWRIDDRHVDSSVEKDQRQGSLGLEGRAADGPWQAHAAMDMIYDSQSDQTADRRRVDMSRGLVEASRGAVAARVGDHTIAGSSFVMDSFARRGISGSVHLDRLRSEVTGFAMRSEPSNGFRHWPGVSDSSNRTDGVVLTTSPLAQNPERLQISATYLDAEGSTAGSSVAASDEPVSGHATDLVADSLTWGQRVRLRAEYAYSWTDFDGSAAALDEDTDDAWSMLAVYQHPQRELRGSAFQWNAGAEHKRIGPQFFSLGNPALPADKQLDQAFGGFNWGGWSVNTQVARETDNVDDDPRFPRMQSDYITIGSNYAPATTQENAGIMRLFAQPNLAVYAQHSARKYADIPVTFGGDRIDDNTDSLSVSLQFVPGNWSWDISHTRSWFSDSANLQVDYVDDLSELGMDLPLSPHVSLSPRVQYERFADHDNDVLTQALLAQVGFRLAGIRNRLDADLNYTVNRNWTDDNSLDTTGYTCNATVAWTVLQPRTNRPGVAVFTNGSYLDDGNVYQIFAGLRIGWQAIY